jgi:hypothetical protein
MKGESKGSSSSVPRLSVRPHSERQCLPGSASGNRLRSGRKLSPNTVTPVPRPRPLSGGSAGNGSIHCGASTGDGSGESIGDVPGG